MSVFVTRSIPARTPPRMQAAVTARKPKVKETLNEPFAVKPPK